MNSTGFPHSEISGSKPVSGSPKLIAAFHVLHRLPIPRHPPSALSSLTISLIKSLTQLLYISQKTPGFPHSDLTAGVHRDAFLLFFYPTIQLSKIKHCTGPVKTVIAARDQMLPWPPKKLV